MKKEHLIVESIRKTICYFFLISDSVKKEKAKQDRQCMCDVTPSRVRKLLLPWKSKMCYLLVWVCVRACGVPLHVGVCMRIHACGLANQACNDYAPYCDVICGPFGFTIFSALSHKGHDFQKKSYWTWDVLILSTPFV